MDQNKVRAGAFDCFQSRADRLLARCAAANGRIDSRKTARGRLKCLGKCRVDYGLNRRNRGMRGKQAQRMAQKGFAAEGSELLWDTASGPRAPSGRHNDRRNLHFVSKSFGIGGVGGSFGPDWSVNH
jgi:hypothetical protein